MRIAVGTFLLVALAGSSACSQEKPGPPLIIQLPRLGAEIDATGYVLAIDEDLHQTSPVTPGPREGVVTAMDRVQGMRRIELQPFPPGSNTITMASLDITSAVKFGSSTPLTLDDCVRDQQKAGGPMSYELRVPARKETRNKFEVAIWEDRYGLGIGPDLHNIRMATVKGNECFVFGATANVNWIEKERPRMEKILRSLRPLSSASAK